MRRQIGPLLLTGFLLCVVLQRLAVGDIAPLSAETLQEQASQIVVGVVTNREIKRDTETDPNWDKRTFAYQIEIEAVEKGNFQRGDTVSASAWMQKWTGSGIQPPSGTGHHPLPMEGERARFFLAGDSTGTLSVLLPNGVELESQADQARPVRIGDPAPPEPVLEIEEESPPKPTGDPFGWEIILVFLAVPLVIGGLRQQSASRWGLLVVACVMFCAAAIIAMW